MNVKASNVVNKYCDIFYGAGCSYGHPIDHIDGIIKETGRLFDDKARIIYVNGEIKDDTPFGKLMQE